MTWKTFHSRGEILRAVEAVANQRLDGFLPMDLEGVRETFDDELDLLATLQLRWHTRLAGRLDHELSRQPISLESAVISAWLATADDAPGVRRILDHYRAEPVDAKMATAITKAVAKEHALLAVMAGLSNTDDNLAVQVGRRIEEKARASYRPASRVAPPARPTLLDRLRAALAA